MEDEKMEVWGGTPLRPIEIKKEKPIEESYNIPKKETKTPVKPLPSFPHQVTFKNNGRFWKIYAICITILVVAFLSYLGFSGNYKDILSDNQTFVSETNNEFDFSPTINNPTENEFKIFNNITIPEVIVNIDMGDYLDEY